MTATSDEHAADLLREMVALWDADSFSSDPDRTFDQFLHQAISWSEQYDDFKARVRAFVEAHDGE